MPTFGKTYRAHLQQRVSRRERETPAIQTERPTDRDAHTDRRTVLVDIRTGVFVGLVVCQYNVRSSQPGIPTETERLPPERAKTRQSCQRVYIAVLSLFLGSTAHIKDPRSIPSFVSQKIVQSNRPSAQNPHQDHVLSQRLR